MSSWEDIANEVAPVGAPVRGLATGANRKPVSTALLAEPADLHIVRPPNTMRDTPLEEILRGNQRTTEQGAFFHVDHPAGDYHAMFGDLPSLLDASLPAIAAKTRVKAATGDLLFLDIETTGLSSGQPLFLIGALSSPRPADARLELFLARTPHEETAALAAFLERVEGKTLVSFNGVRFDWPYIAERARLRGLAVPQPRAHFDLLPFSRKRWRAQVPNCRLQTLEYYVCGRQREGDAPSAEIPQRYRLFTQIYANSGHGAHLITPIVYHNIWDVLTMADLLRRGTQ